jgi:hypothetical protein
MTKPSTTDGKGIEVTADPTHYRREIAAPQTAPTLIVEDGTGVPGANTYISLAYADAYHDAALYATEWTNATADQKPRALIEAARMIDASMKFNGFKAKDANALEWPRIYAQNTEGSGTAYWIGYGTAARGNYYSATEIPERLRKAQAELAGELLKKDRSAEWSALGIGQVGLGQGAVDVTFTGDAASTAAMPFTPAVLDLLQPLGYPRSGSSQAIVRRG